MIVANEVRLLLACARRELRPDDRAALRRCLAAPLDWDRLLRLARWHGLRPLVNRHLAACDEVPRGIALGLWGEATAVGVRNRAMHEELARILSLFELGGIRALPYKGPALALRAYGDLALREFSDLDILVARSQVQRARDALCAAGYAREYALEPAIESAYLDSPAQYHLVVRAPEDGPMVELHWKTDPDFAVERLEDMDWWAATRSMSGLPSMPDEDLVLVLCIHGSKHLWANLGWLVDVAELLRSPGDLDWERLVARAGELRASRRVGVGLRLAAELLDAPLAQACRNLAERADVAHAAGIVRAALVAAEPGPLPAVDAMRAHWRMHETWHQGIRELYRTVCLPSLVEWTRWPLPRALFFAYPALRLVRLAGKYFGRGLSAGWEGRKLHS